MKAAAVLVAIMLVLGTGAALAQEKVEEEPAEKKADVGSKVEKLVKQLGAEDFKEREAATEELEKIGEPAVPALKEALKSEDAEVRSRAELILKEIEKPTPGTGQAQPRTRPVPPPERDDGLDNLPRADSEAIRRMLEKFKELEKKLEKEQPGLPPFPGEEDLLPDSVKKALEEMQKQMEESRKRFDDMRKRFAEPRTRPEGEKKEAETPRRAPQPGQAGATVIIKRLTWKNGKLVEDEEYKSDSALPGIAVTGDDSVMGSLRYHLELAENEGVLIETVEKDSPFARAGVQKHDIIARVDGSTVGSRDELAQALKGKEKVTVEVIHKGERRTQEVSLKDAGTPEGKKEEKDK
jgi:hypothetical protein